MTVRKSRNQKALDKFMANKKLNVGFLDGATYPDGTSVAYVASIHEFGARNTPARPFIRPAMQKSKPWMKVYASKLKAGNSADEGLEVLGSVVAGDIAKSIKSVNSPALSPFTIDRKGFAKPLVDTGLMFASVTYLVENK
jgi:hypothetical protein